MINVSILRRQPYSHSGHVLQRCVTPSAVTVSQCPELGTHRAPVPLPCRGCAGVAGRVSAWLVTSQGGQ